MTTQFPDQLTAFGYDEWFQRMREESANAECSIARVTRVDRERYLVQGEHGEVHAEAAGKLVFSIESPQELPCVGDWAFVQYHNEGAFAIIRSLLPRRTFLRRKAAGKKIDYQMIAANLDVAFIMQSCDENFNLRRMERYLVMINDGGIRPVILLSKSDLIPPEELAELLLAIRADHIDTTVMTISAITGEGVEELKRALERGKTYCLLGSSGVGKTTLLNHLLGHDEFATQPVREADSRGRHTTTRRQITVIDNGALIIDTPGMRELGVLAAEAGLDESFADIHDLTSECKFNDCSHTSEKGCAVIASVEKGELDEARYQNYLKLLRESAFNELNYTERRARDRSFGRMVNTAMKQMKKRKPR